MGSAPEVFDISSDEEPDGFSLDKSLDESYDWINELLDDKEDIVVVDQFSNTTENSGSDDDCKILDGDPDKQVAVGEHKRDGGDGSDDLLIVGQKGQIACRDFPHSRHLCANFPFNTISHEKHCNLCHCYVCDSPAPCIYWGNGALPSDHCHATDKDEAWEARRKSFKGINGATLPPQKLPHTTERVLPPPVRNYQPVNRSISVSQTTQSSRSNPLRPCSSITTAPSYAPTQRQHQQPSTAHYRGQRLEQHLTKSQPHPGTPYVQREKRGAGSLASSIMQSHSKFRRVGTTGSCLLSSSTNRSQYTSSNLNQMPRSVQQKPQYPPVASLRSQQRPVASLRNQSMSVSSQRSQCTPVTTQPVASPRTQSMPSSSQRSHRTPATSQTVASLRTGSLPVSLQRSVSAPVTTQISQNTSVTSSEDSIRKWEEILAGVASELGVSESISKNTASVQPYTASSQPREFGIQISCQMNSSQGIRPNTHLGAMTILSNPMDSLWLDSTAGQTFPEQGQGGDFHPAAMRPSNPEVSGCNSAVSGDFHLESILESGKVLGLSEVEPASLLYDFEHTWSGFS